MSLTTHQKDFIKRFDALCHTRNRGTAFSDWLEVTACAVHQIPYEQGALAPDANYKKIEAAYMAEVKKYQRDELNIFAELLGMTILALGTTPHTDFLGPIYMEMGLGDVKRGEFFTPEPIAELMARMQMGDISRHIKKQGHFTICDPCIGAGVMLIKAAQDAERQGFDRRQMVFEATDLARAGFNMAYIQLSLLGLVGVVVHGNTLTLETFERRATPAFKIARQQTKQHGEQSGKIIPLAPPTRLALGTEPLALAENQPTQKRKGTA